MEENIDIYLSANTENAKKNMQNLVKVLDGAIFKAQQLELEFSALGKSNNKKLEDSFTKVGKIVESMMEDITSGNTSLDTFNGHVKNVVSEYKNLYNASNDVKRSIKETTDAAKKQEDLWNRIAKVDTDSAKTRHETKLKLEREFFTEVSNFQKKLEQQSEKARQAELSDLKQMILGREKLKVLAQERVNTSIFDAEKRATADRQKKLSDLKQAIIDRSKEQDLINKKELEEQIIIAKTNALKKLGVTTDIEKVSATSKNIAMLQAEYDVLKAKNIQGEHTLTLRKLELQLTKENLAARKAEAALDNAPTEKSGFASAATAAKRALGYTALFAAIAAVTTAVRGGIEYSIEYNKALLQMQASLDLTSQQANTLELNLQGLSIQYGEQLSSLNKVALELGRAGVAYETLGKATKIVNQLAILTGDTIESSAAAVVSYVQVFSKDNFGQVIATTEELGAKLAFLANASKMNTQDINTFSNYALASAKAVGMTIDQVNALAVSLNNAGKNASTVGTNIRRFTTILGDSDTKVQEFFMKIGVNQRTLQREFAKGGEASNKAFIGFINTLSSYSTEAVNESLNGMDILTRDTLQAIRNSSTEIKKAFIDSMGVTRDEIDKANKVAESFERRLISIQNVLKEKAKGITDGLIEGFISSLEYAITDTPYEKLLDMKAYQVEDITNRIKEGAKDLELFTKRSTNILDTKDEKTITEYLKLMTDYQNKYAFILNNSKKATETQKVQLQDLVNKFRELATKPVEIEIDSTKTFKDLGKKIEEAKQILSTLTPGGLGYEPQTKKIQELTLEQNKLLETTKEVKDTYSDMFKLMTSEASKGLITNLDMIQTLYSNPETQNIAKEMLRVTTDTFNQNLLDTIPSIQKYLALAFGDTYQTELDSMVNQTGNSLFNSFTVFVAKLKQKKLELEIELKTASPETLDSLNKQLDNINIAITSAETGTAVITKLGDVNKNINKQTESDSKKLNNYLSERLSLQQAISVNNLKLAGQGVSELTLAQQELEVAKLKHKEAISNANSIAAAKERELALLQAEKDWSTSKLKYQEEEKRINDEASKDKLTFLKLDFDRKALEEQIAGVKKSEVEQARDALALAEKEYKARLEQIQKDTRLNDQQRINAELEAGNDKLKAANTLTKAIADSNKDYTDRLRDINKEITKYNYLLSNTKIPDNQETTDWYNKERADIEANFGASDPQRANLLAQLDILKQQKEEYVGIKKAFGDYVQSIPSANQALENLTNGAISAMQSGMTNFFDISSDGFLDMGQLAKSVLSSILQQIIQNIVVAQIMRAIMGGFSSGSAEIGGVSSLGSLSLATRAEGGYIPTQGYATGGLLTGGSGMRDDLYLGNVNGTRVFAMGGEYITTKDSVNNNTRPTLEYINQTGQVPMQQAATQVSVNTPVSIKVENQSGTPIEAEMLKQFTQMNQQGEEEKVVQIILKKMNTDLAFRNAVRGGR